MMESRWIDSEMRYWARCSIVAVVLPNQTKGKVMTGHHWHRQISRPSRRSVLLAGVLGGLGLTFPGFLRRAQGAERPARARSAILIWLNGGLTHHDTFDPKPDAVAEIRGELGTIATSVTG